MYLIPSLLPLYAYLLPCMHACTRGKAIGSVVVVNTKIAKSAKQAVLYSGKFSHGANFRILHMCILYAKNKNYKNFNDLIFA